MAEKPSNTSNHQRLEEMMCHLTPEKAVVPYNVCFDLENNIWVASKGGLFKFDPAGKELLFCLRNDFPKKVAPYAQVLLYKTKIIYTTCDDKALTEFRILRSADGTVEHQHFVDGKIQSLAVTEEGDLFMTKQPTADAEESVIWRSHIDSPVGWEEFYSDFEQTFQAICAFDNNTLAVAAVSMPVNIYSKQCLKWLDTTSCRPSGNNFASAGKGEGQIYFPRCMRSWDNALLVMDKTGRIQKFSRAGQFERVAAKIDDYIGNGFTVRGDEAVIACSGIVLDQNGESICDDWIEAIRLDGSKWTNTSRN